MEMEITATQIVSLYSCSGLLYVGIGKWKRCYFSPLCILVILSIYVLLITTEVNSACPFSWPPRKKRDSRCAWAGGGWVYNFSDFRSPGRYITKKTYVECTEYVRRHTPATASSRQPQTTNTVKLAVLLVEVKMIWGLPMMSPRGLNGLIQ
jgi:hypothetical protein